MDPRSRDTHTREAAGGGVVAGAIGGVLLSLYMAFMSLASGEDAWRSVKFAGYPFLGERATLPGPDGLAALVGFASHMAVSIVWGVLFGLLFYGLAKGVTVLAGLLWGIVVWLGMFYVVLPIVGLPDVARQVPVGLAIFEHLLFGLAVGIAFLPFQREVPAAEGAVRQGPPSLRLWRRRRAGPVKP